MFNVVPFVTASPTVARLAKSWSTNDTAIRIARPIGELDLSGNVGLTRESVRVNDALPDLETVKTTDTGISSFDH
jgi:hypothetical protein